MTADIPGLRLDRRTALAVTGAAATALTLAGCDTYGANEAASTAPAGAGPGKQQQPAELATTAEVPVGGGVVKGDTVITQPTAGSYQAFSNVCTHLGCKVNEPADGKIVCPCHNSVFGLDGAVLSGPAGRPLDSRGIRVEGDRIFSE
ncbi:Rieske (2Fe-2S) protein [Nocardia huaxiensis]|uniref:Cytochrome bc1 complex Rieske iron-sulfur subunit n=1 Tax=Nocardia huaxiensis TaxID=2755382 RepID=A0A7D6VMK4_9NOCA|nr:Rieske (2Fe-2S) protein [Nocardia huaxiensis]QLY33216.1 Rieske (2Fe-2S) protein [Nocardia huaxiensis]